jgi:nucleotide-binding universal stress UspA family protein
MYDDILLATDGQESNDRLLPYARDVATRHDARVHGLYVVDDRAFFALDDDTRTSAADQLRAEGQRTTERLVADLESAGIDANRSVRRGDPAAEIVEYIETRSVDLVVMGTRGDQPAENMLGSTAQQVVSSSPVPVLTVPIPTDSDYCRSVPDRPHDVVRSDR